MLPALFQLFKPRGLFHFVYRTSSFSVLSCPISFHWCIFVMFIFSEFLIINANSVEPIQMPRHAASDLGPHRSSLYLESNISRKWVETERRRRNVSIYILVTRLDFFVPFFYVQLAYGSHHVSQTFNVMCLIYCTKLWKKCWLCCIYFLLYNYELETDALSVICFAFHQPKVKLVLISNHLYQKASFTYPSEGIWMKIYLY